MKLAKQRSVDRRFIARFPATGNFLTFLLLLVLNHNLDLERYPGHGQAYHHTK